MVSRLGVYVCVMYAIMLKPKALVIGCESSREAFERKMEGETAIG